MSKILTLTCTPSCTGKCITTFYLMITTQYIFRVIQLNLFFKGVMNWPLFFYFVLLSEVHL